MQSFGDVSRTACPLCESVNFHNVWKIPFTRIAGGVVNRVKLLQVPLLSSTMVYSYSQCKDCGTIFLDPYSGTYWDNRNIDHHPKKARERQEWSNYQQRVQYLLNVPILQYNTVVDIATGGCQCLTVMKEMGIPWKRMIATDIQQPSVDYANELGYEGYQHDICKDPLICENEANYVIFAEAFEHVQSPLIAMQNIAKMLAPDGYVYFTATATEGNLPVRPGEDIMVTEKALIQMLLKCGLTMIMRKFSSERWLVVAQKVPMNQ